MGGTFDPIHHGHLVAASEVAHVFAPGRGGVRAHRPALAEGRPEGVAAEDRYLMTVIATASNPRFSVSRVDIDRPGPTYTIDTLRDLRAERGEDAELFFITGADALAQIMSWQDVDELFKLAHFVGCTRPGHQLTEHGPAERQGEPGRDPGPGDLLDRVPAAGRQRASRSGTWCRTAIVQYIAKRGLYRDGDVTRAGPREGSRWAGDGLPVSPASLEPQDHGPGGRTCRQGGLS